MSIVAQVVAHASNMFHTVMGFNKLIIIRKLLECECVLTTGLNKAEVPGEIEV